MTGTLKFISLFTRILAMSATFAITAGQSQAQTTSSTEPSLRANWAGPFAGLLVGKRSARDQEIFLPREEAVPNTNAAAVLGYNWQFGALVAGVEGEVSRAEHHANSAAARARLGVAIGPALLYATAGLAWTKDYGTTVKYFGSGDIFSITETASMRGNSLGGGIELMLSPSWTIRAEAQHTRFPQTMVTFPPIRSFSEIQLPVRFEETTVRLGALYHFGIAGSEEAPTSRVDIDWSGPYVGVDGGVKLDDFHIEPVSGSWRGTVYNDTSWQTFAGIHAGHLWQSGSVVAGLELDLARSNAEFPTQMALARLGYAWRSHLAYAIAGVTRSTARLNEYQKDEILTRNHLGGIYGLGLESRIDKSLSLRLEAMQFYGNDERYDFSGTMSCRRLLCTGIGSPPRNARVDDQIVRAGLSYHFD